METGKGKENANRQKNMLDTVKINHVQHISFTQSRLTDVVSVILSESLSYEHPPKRPGLSYKRKEFVKLRRSDGAKTVQGQFLQPLSGTSAAAGSDDPDSGSVLLLVVLLPGAGKPYPGKSVL